MITMTRVAATMTSDCICEYYDEDDNLVPSYNECFGCWDDSVYDFEENILMPWYAANDYHDKTPIKIVSPNLGWMRQAGYCDTYAEEILDKLKINGDFTLRWTLEGNTLTCVRSSHDELGASFTFELREEDEY